MRISPDNPIQTADQYKAQLADAASRVDAARAELTAALDARGLIAYAARAERRLTYAEIGAALDITPQAVQKLLAKGPLGEPE